MNSTRKMKQQQQQHQKTCMWLIFAMSISDIRCVRVVACGCGWVSAAFFFRFLANRDIVHWWHPDNGKRGKRKRKKEKWETNRELSSLQLHCTIETEQKWMRTGPSWNALAWLILPHDLNCNCNRLYFMINRFSIVIVHWFFVSLSFSWAQICCQFSLYLRNHRCIAVAYSLHTRQFLETMARGEIMTIDVDENE